MSDNINNTNPPSEPLTRVEQYLSAIAGVTSSSDIPDEPLTRIEEYLNKIVENGGGGGGGGSFEPTDEQLAAMNSGITSEDVEQIETNKTNISTLQTSLAVGSSDNAKVLTAIYEGGTGSYSWVTPTALKSYTVSKPSDGSVNTATFDWSQLATGRTYLISCRNHTSPTSRYGISIYVFVKISDDSLELWTPISDITNAKITSYVISGNTLTLTYDVQGYHTVKIVDFNI